MTHGLKLHGHLVGKAGSRHLLNTPSLIVDLEALERNIAGMASFARSRKVHLRPHTKTHKSVEIARRQMASGAIGICCAKLGEAEAFKNANIASILITSPVVAHAGIVRLCELNRHVEDLMVVVDHESNVDAIAAHTNGKQMSVIIDIDPGMQRTGVTSPESAVKLARRITSHRSLRFRGVQFFCGQLQHIRALQARKSEVAKSTAYLRIVVEQLTREGLQPEIVTGSGTGTHMFDGDAGAYTELQVGSYVFMDMDYNACDLSDSGHSEYFQALQIDSTVVSANTPGMVTLDAGLKAMATEKGPPRVIAGALASSITKFMGDEHLALVVPDGESTPAYGARVVLMPPHCDPTVNLYDEYHVVIGDRLVDIWPVDARGRSA